MVKRAELNSEAQEFIELLSKSLKEKSIRVSPIELAQYVGIAFERTFTGVRREDKLAKAIARGVSVREKMAAEEGGSMSADETARLLGMTKQSVLSLYHAGKYGSARPAPVESATRSQKGICRKLASLL